MPRPYRQFGIPRTMLGDFEVTVVFEDQIPRKWPEFEEFDGWTPRRYVTHFGRRWVLSSGRVAYRIWDSMPSPDYGPATPLWHRLGYRPTRQQIANEYVRLLRKRDGVGWSGKTNKELREALLDQTIAAAHRRLLEACSFHSYCSQ